MPAARIAAVAMITGRRSKAPPAAGFLSAPSRARNVSAWIASSPGRPPGGCCAAATGSSGDGTAVIADLLPAYFALVMATGVLAIAAATLGWHVLTWPLVVVAAVAYAVLWALNGVRLARYPGRVLADLQDHARGPGFFTVVAATCILGTACVVILHRPDVASVLWGLGV